MKTIEELKERLISEKLVVEQELNEIPEEFNTLQEAEDYNYFCGRLEVVNDILEFIGGNENAQKN